jgi:molybdenum cofactor guanylyltransferase
MAFIMAQGRGRGIRDAPELPSVGVVSSPMTGAYHTSMTAVAGVVLAGGRSSRMGRSKAELEWYGSTLLRRVTGILARAVDGPVIVVRAPGQRLPSLAPHVRVHDDPQEGVGPLQGLAVGLTAAGGSAEVAFVSSTDMPLLHPAFVRCVVAALREAVDVAMPVAHGHPQPLAAAYRTMLAAEVGRWMDGGERRLTAVAARTRVALLRPDDLLADPAVAAGDPALASLRNLNRPEDYRAARALGAPRVTVRLRTAVAPSARTVCVCAATVAGAMAELGLPGGAVDVDLDGVTVSDGMTPLVDGDELEVVDLRVAARRGGNAMDHTVGQFRADHGEDA